MRRREADEQDVSRAELEAMYSLRKYRAMKQRYYDEPPKSVQ